jgi:hypothetical protein
MTSNPDRCAFGRQLLDRGLRRHDAEAIVLFESYDR